MQVVAVDVQRVQAIPGEAEIQHGVQLPLTQLRHEGLRHLPRNHDHEERGQNRECPGSCVILVQGRARGCAAAGGFTHFYLHPKKSYLHIPKVLL